MVPLNDLSRLPNEVLSEIESSIASILRSGWFLKGPYTSEFEDILSRRFQNRSVVTVGNGTDALYLAMCALDVGPTVQIGTVANAGGYASGAALRLGADVHFVDVDPTTAQMSAESLERLLSDQHLDVLVVTHLYGSVGDIDRITQICQANSIRLIEDCAQAYGATFNGRPIGTFGDIATLSFYPTKNLGGFGDGGAVICGSAELATFVASLAQYGWNERYSVSAPLGINSRLDEVQAACLIELDKHLDGFNARRRSILDAYSLACSDGRSMIGSELQGGVAHLAVMCTETRTTDSAFLQLHEIATGIHYPVLDYEQPAWQHLFPNTSCTNAEWLKERILTLPCFPTLTDNEERAVVTRLAELAARA